MIEELKILLSLPQDVSDSANHKELLASVFDRIRPIFDYDFALIYLWEQGGSHYKLVATDELSEATRHPVMEHLFQGAMESVGSPYEKLGDLTEPAFFSAKDWLEKYPNFPGRQLIHDYDYLEHLVLPLRYKNDSIGLVEFFSQTQDKLKATDVNLYKVTADQISIALTNILFSEEVASKRLQQELLFEISKDITTIIDRHALIDMIISKIKPVFDFYEVSLILISGDGQYHWNLMTKKTDEEDQQTRFLHDREKNRISHVNSPIEWLAHQSEKLGTPVVFKYSDLVNAYPNYPLLENKAIEPTSAISTNLRSRGKTLGIFCLNALNENAFTEKDFTFFQGIADQISIAIQTILINEESLERQAEKEILLSISEDISRSRNKKQLFETVSQKIKPLFEFHDMGLFVLSEDGEYHTDLAVDAPEVHSSEWNMSLAEFDLGKTPHKNSPIEHIIDEVTKAGHALLFDNKRELFVEYISCKYIEYNKFLTEKR